MTATSRTIKVFKLDDIEWWAGESLEECIREARDQAGRECYPDAEHEAHEVGAESMQKLIFIDEETDERRSFADELARRVADPSEEFPQLFAATDY